MTNAIFTNNSGESSTIKLAGEKLKYDFDFTLWLDNLLETITGTPTVVGAGLTITDVSFTGGVVSSYISGGTAGQTLEALCTINTSSGMIKQKKLILYIK